MTQSGWSAVEGPRGARGFRGSIQGAVRRGWDLAQLRSHVESIYSQQGMTLRANTWGAIERAFSQMTELESKSRQLSHVRGDIAVSARWIAWSTLERSLESWNASPRLYGRARVSGTIEGLAVSQWVTLVAEGRAQLPVTVGDWREMLMQIATTGRYSQLVGATNVSTAELAISAY